MTPIQRQFASLLALGLLFAVGCAQSPPAFVHPGLLQTASDLDFMKQKVAAGEEPWKTAYSHLCNQPYSSMDFQPKAIAHVVRGAYGKPSIGDHALMDSASAAYSQALQWIITGDKAHAQKAIEIINAWSGTLWDLEDNDAKLLAGWTAHTFCNAAEILAHTDSGWKPQDIAQFKRMLRTVYFPLIRDFQPQANGNWDAAMIDSMLCIGVFCDDHAIFNRAVDHFLRGEGNSGITKYVYPSGQCQESTRDQSHVQLGLGELAQACQVAWNQNVDLYGAADNRLAIGFEYTATYLLGEDVPVYGTISPQGREKISDVYEGIYQHYHFDKGLPMPYTGRILAKAREGNSWSALTLYRVLPETGVIAIAHANTPDDALHAGAMGWTTARAPDNAIKLTPGDSIQKALDSCTKGGWVVLDKGAFVLDSTLRIPSGVTLSGQGLETILTLDPKLMDRPGAALINADEDLHNVTLRDFVIEGNPSVAPNATHNDPNVERVQRANTGATSRAGIIFKGNRDGQVRDLHLAHLTVRNCTHDGVAIVGASGVDVVSCDFSDCGSRVSPGPGLHDNLRLSHVEHCRINDCRLDTSIFGSGLDLAFASDVTISNNEIARNARDGIHIADSRDVAVSGNLIEGNDCDGISLETLASGSTDVQIYGNIARNNGPDK